MASTGADTPGASAGHASDKPAYAGREAVVRRAIAAYRSMMVNYLVVASVLAGLRVWHRSGSWRDGLMSLGITAVIAGALFAVMHVVQARTGYVPDIRFGLTSAQRAELKADVKGARPSSDPLLANVEREHAIRWSRAAGVPVLVIGALIVFMVVLLAAVGSGLTVVLCGLGIGAAVLALYYLVQRRAALRAQRFLDVVGRTYL